MPVALKIDIKGLETDWRAGMKPAALAEKYGCSALHLYKLRSKHKLRVKMKNGSKEPAAPTARDEQLSGASLRLSPWVVARIAKLGY